jgi:carbamoyl-phosphate synthase large subunit
MNLLFTCSGRRNYLIDFFREIKDVRITSCDASIFAPSLYYSDDFFIVPEVYEPNYVDILLEESKKRRIDAIIPLNDLELPILAFHKQKFESEHIAVIVASKDVVDLCFDKYATWSFTKILPLSTIPTFFQPKEAFQYKEDNPECSFIIKPRWGTASIGIEFPENEEELIYQYNQVKRKILNSFLKTVSSVDYENCVLIQKKLTGQEFGMDVINNLKGEFEATLIRRKISMRAGETDKAEMVHDDMLFNIGRVIGQRLGHIGNLDCDLFIENDDVYLLEMNPRFGGGYPFSHAAGANLPLALIEWLSGNPSPPGSFRYKDRYFVAKVDKLVTMMPEVAASTLKAANVAGNKKANVYIVGAGGFGREIETWVSQSKGFTDKYKLLGFIDDNPDVLSGFPSNYKVLGRIDEFDFKNGDAVLLGIADPATKAKVVDRLKGKVSFLTYISEKALIGKFVTIGEGTIIAPNCVLSTNITIGSFVMLNIGTQIGHDATISDFSSVMANIDISGTVSVGKYVYIGSKATITPGRKIGDRAKISAGSLIIQDIPASSFVFGNHAKIMKYNL